MAPKKKVTALIKLQIQAGAATPAPPVGPALGQHGVNIMDFVKAYNAATESQKGNIIPVEITVFEDRSFTFITKTPPASRLILKAAGIEKGSAIPHKDKVGMIRVDRNTSSEDIRRRLNEFGFFSKIEVKREDAEKENTFFIREVGLLERLGELLS